MYRNFFKRFFDIIFSLILTPAVLLVVVFTAPFIYFTDRGSIFYIAKRRGRNGKTFGMLKLRTMKTNAPEIRNSDGSVYTGKNDPRVTKVGRFLRRFSIDELPQILNVLKGDMSLVGTRPPTLDEWEKYSPAHRARLAARPGITGMWQVNGRNEVMDFDEVVRLDMEYIRNWSLLLDLKLLARTVTVIFRGNGAL